MRVEVDDFEIDFDKKMRREIEKMLGDLKKKAPRVIAVAANHTATEVRKLLAEAAHGEYTVKKKFVKFRREMSIAKAKGKNLTATIKASGRPLELFKFDVKPRTVNPKRRKAPHGRVLTASGMKALQTGNLKAFIVQFASGHMTVAQRVGPERLPLKVLYSPSVPTMLASEENVFGPLKVQINSIFREQCLIEIQKIINAKKAGDTK